MRNTSSLDPKAAFFHVIDPHRWLAASGCNWNLAGAPASGELKARAHELLPNVDVMILNALLLHARCLIKFYLKRAEKPTDIHLGVFLKRVSLEKHCRKKLEEYEQPIEVHLLHLTEWRDPGHRKIHGVGKHANKHRPDWNLEAAGIVEAILDALRWVSDHAGNWQRPFRDLHQASRTRYLDTHSVWPKHLGEEDDVASYLSGLGL